MASFDLTDISNTNTALSIIKEYGFVRIPSFIEGDELNEFISIFETGLIYDNYKYGYGKMARFEMLPTKLSLVESFFGSSFFKEIIDGFWNSNNRITKEYSFIHDFKFDENTIYGYLHFDRRHQLKFMLYLSDVESINHGAFCAIPKSNILGRELYTNSWNSLLELELDNFTDTEKITRTILDDDPRYRALPFRIIEDNLQPNNSGILENIQPITGPAGTLIIFDTHVLHLGGHVTNNFERKTIRLHTFIK